LAKRKIKKLNLDYIYLATDEKRIEYQFYEAFPNKILVNRRVYVDDVFYSKNCRRISGAIEKKGVDLSFSNLSYLSSICLLARCNALIAGNCGGSEAALCMNNFKYEYWHLFKMGLYKDTI
jgi:hypothetical protein